MRLPLLSWTNTLSSLGMRVIRRKPQQSKRRSRPRRLQFEALEQRQMLSANVLDDADLTYAETDTWSNVGSGYASQSRSHSGTSGTASWTFESMSPGQYEFFATFPADTNRTTAAEYAIYDDQDLLDTAVLDQTAAPNDESYDGVQWESLGIFTIAEDTVTIELSHDVSSTVVVADAVRWEAVPTLPLKLDFGTGSTESGFTSATDSTVYASQAGYGWTAGQSLSNYSGSGNNLLQDFVYTSSTSLSFQARVADGDYDVTLGWGGYHYSTLDEVEVSLEGAAQEEFSLDSGEAYANVYRVTVTDGVLNIDLADLGGSSYLQLNYLEITDASDPPAPTLPLRLDLGNYSTASGFNQADHQTLFSPTYGSSSGYGWTIAPTYSSTGGSSYNNYLTYDFVYTYDKSMTFVANVADGDYDVTLGWGGYHYSTLNNIDVHIEGELLETITPGSNQGYANTYRVSISDGHLTLHLADQDSSGFIQLNYLEIQEAADPPAPSLPLRLDFGQEYSWVESGYTGASENTVYTGQAGYGWVATQSMYNSSGGSSNNYLTYDYVYTYDSTMTFLTRFADGEYDVTLGWGPHKSSTFDNVEVRAEGQVLETISLGYSEGYANVYRVTVNDGLLNLQLADVGGSNYIQLNYLEVREAANPPALSLPLRLDFGSYNTASGFMSANHETRYSPTWGSPTGYGWTIAPTNSYDYWSGPYLTRDFVYTYDAGLTFVADVADGEYDVTLGWGNYHYSTFDNIQVRIEGQTQETVTLGYNQGHANTYRVTVTDGHLTIHLSDQGGSTYVDLAYLEIQEAVDPPAPSLPLKLDFGQEYGSVESGYTGASENSLYTGQAGYGWVSGNLSNYNSYGSSYLLQDYVYTSDSTMTFLTRLADGEYDVILGWRTNYSTMDQIEVRLEGATQETISLSSNEGYANVYRVTVNDGLLNLQLADMGGSNYLQLNYLEIHQAANPPALSLPLRLDFGSYNTASGFMSANHETRYSPTWGSPTGYGWTIAPTNSYDYWSGPYLTRDFVYTYDAGLTFVADVADGEYDVTLGWGNYHYSTFDNIQVRIEGQTLETVTLGYNQGHANTYRVTVSDGHLTIHLSDQGGSNYVDLAYLEIQEAVDPPAPSLPLKLDFGQEYSSVESGYTSAHENSVYTGQAGYGWVPSSQQIYSFNAGGSSYLLQDFVYTSGTSLSYIARVADGIYDVTLGWGGYHFSTLDEVEISLEGVAREEITLSSGEAYANVYRVTVTDGMLNVDLADLGGAAYLQLNYLEIHEATGSPTPTLPLRLDFGSGSTANGFTYASDQTLYSPTYGSSNGYGWTIAPSYSGSGGSWYNNYLTYDFVYTNNKSMTFVANVADGDYDVTLGWSGYRNSTLDNIDVHVEGALLESISLGSNQGYANTYRVTVSDGHLTLHLADQDTSGYIDLAYLEIQEATDPPAPSIPLKLDFGPESSYPESGFTTAHEYSTYTGGAGYGWVPTYNQLSSYNSYSGSYLLQDFVYTSDSSLKFQARLEDGDYDVILGWGPYHYSTLDGIEVRAEGQTLETVSLGYGEPYANVYRVTVTDGMLNLELADVSGGTYIQLNYLQVVEAVSAPSLPLRLDLGSYNTASGFIQADHQTHYIPNYGSPTGYGWTVPPGYSGTGGSSSNYLTYDFVYTNDKSMVFAAAVADGEYDVTLGWSAYHYSVTSFDNIEVRIEGELVDTLNLAYNQGYANTYRVNVTDGHLTIRFTDQGGSSTFIDLAYLEIEEAVETPPPSLPLRVDFGQDYGSVESGYVGASENTSYTGQTGFGLTPSQYLSSYSSYSPYGSSYLLNDFVYTSNYDTSLAFQARVPDGEYDVILGWGPYKYYTFDNIEVRLEGVAHETISLDSGEGYANVYRVNVTDGMLNVELADLGGTTYLQLNYLEIHEAAEPPTPTLPLRLDFGNYSTASGFTYATHETRYSPSWGSPTGYGWVIPPGYSSYGGSSNNYLISDFVYTNDRSMTFVANVADGDYDVTLGWGTYHSGTLSNVEVQIEGETRDLISLAYNQGYANSYRVSVTDGHLTLHLYDQDYTGYVDLAYLEITEADDPPPSLPLKIDFGSDYSPVESGYTGASDNTVYTALTGFGWVPEYGMYNYTGGGGSYLTQDFVYSTYDNSVSFLARLENGEYDVTLGWGPYRYTTLDHVQVSLEDVPLETISLASDQAYDNTYRIRVTDGLLNVKLTDLGGTNYLELAYLEIAAAADPPAVTGAHHVMLVKDGDPLSYNLADWFHDPQDAAENLTFTIENNSAPSLVTASITNGVLQLTPASTLGSTQVTLRATDPGSLYGEVTITAAVYEPDNNLETTGGGSLISLPWGLIDDENVGTLVSDLIAGLTNTANPTGLGMVIYHVASHLGTFQYTTDGGQTWTDVGEVNPTDALPLLADSNTRVRFLPATGSGTATFLSAATAIFQFAGWNGAVGQAGQRMNLAAPGNQGAIAPVPQQVQVQNRLPNMEFVVNSTTTADQTGSKSAMAADGRSVVAWVSHGPQGKRIYAQRFNADGTRLGGEVLIASSAGSSQLPFVVRDVAIDSGNTFVIVTQEQTSSSPLYVSTQVRRFTWTTAGTVGNPITYTNSGFINVDSDLNGDTLFLARSDGSTVVAEAYDVNHASLAQTQVYGPSSYYTTSFVGIAVAADNSLVVAWNRNSTQPHREEILARRYTFNGNSIDFLTDIQVLSSLDPASHPSMLLTQPSVEMNAAKEAVVFWSEHWWGQNYDNAFRIAKIDTNGVAGTTVALAKEPGLATYLQPYWLATHIQNDGKLLVVGTGGPEGKAVGQYFGLDGNPVGQRFDISHLTTGLYQAPGVTGTGQGQVLIVWDELGAQYPQASRDGSGAAVVARFLGPGSPTTSQPPPYDRYPTASEYSLNADNGESRFTIYTRPINVEVNTGYVIFRPDRGPDAAGLDGIIPVYRQTNDRHPIVAVDYVVPINVPDKLEVTLKLGNIPNANPVYFSLPTAGPGQVVRLAVQADNVSALPTGHYNFQIEVKEHRGGVIGEPKQFHGTVDIINRRQSEFGVGWWLDSLDRIITGEGSYYEGRDGGGQGVLLVRGDGTAGWFAEADANGNYITPAGSFTKLEKSLEDGTFLLIHPNGTTDKFTADGLLDTRTDRNGNVIDYTYEDKDGDNKADELTKIKDIYGLETTYVYETGRLDKVRDFAGRETDFTINQFGYPSEVDYGYYVTKIAEPDPDGEETDYVSPETDFTYFLSSIYDVKRRGLLESITTPGIQTDIAVSRPVTMIGYGAEGRFHNAVLNASMYDWELAPAQTVGLATGSTAFASRPALTQDKIKAVYTNERNYKWSYAVDRYGYMTAETDPLNHTWHYVRDKNGLVRQMIEPKGAGGTANFSHTLTTFYDYDQVGNLLMVAYPQSTGSTTDPASALITESWEYFGEDKFYQLKKHTDTRQIVTEYELTSDGKNVEMIHQQVDPQADVYSNLQTPGWVTTYFEYWTNTTLPGGLVKAVFDAYGSEDAVETTNEYYDSTATGNQVGLLKSTTAADNTFVEQTTYFKYDIYRNAIIATNDSAVASGQAATLGDNERTIRYEYDRLNRLHKARNQAVAPLGEAIVVHNYDAEGYKISTIDAANKTTNFEYDQMGRLTKVLLPAPGGHQLTETHRPETVYVYDDAGNLTNEKILVVAGATPQQNTYRVTTHVYDARNQLDKTIYPAPGYEADIAGLPPQSGQDIQPIVDYEYDSAGNLKWQTDPRYGGATSSMVRVEYTYDAIHRQTIVTTPAPNGVGYRPSSTMQYYDDGLVQKVTVPSPALGTNPVATTEYFYDGLGRLVQQINPESGGDNNTQLKTEYVYDARGNVKLVKERNQNNALLRTTTNYYDELDRLIASDGADVDASHLGVSTYYSYNAAGNVAATLVFAGNVVESDLTQSKITDDEINYRMDQVWTQGGANNIAQKSTFAYDKLGQLKQKVGPDGVLATYTFDINGNMTQVKSDFYEEVNGEPELKSLVTNTEYDALGRAWRTLGVVTPNSQRPESLLIFNLDGSVRTQGLMNPNDADNWVTTDYAYDGVGRVKAITTDDPADTTDGRLTTLIYRDAAGNVTRTIDPFQLETRAEYDEAGLVKRTGVQRALVAVTENGNPVDLTGVFVHTFYEYNAAGLVRNQMQNAASTTTVYAIYGSGVTFEYDNLGRITKQIDDTKDNATTADAVTEFTYDVFGHRATLKSPKNDVTTFTVDVLGRVTKESITGDITGSGSSVTLERVYGYDSFGNLLTYTNRNGKAIAYSYDNLGRRTQEDWQNSPYVADFEYSTLGELANAKNADGNGLISEYDYEYDVARRLDMLTGTLRPFGIEESDKAKFTYQYDVLGSLSQVTADLPGTTRDYLNTYTYDALGRTLSVAQQATGTSTINAKHVAYAYQYRTYAQAGAPLLETIQRRYASSTATGTVVATSAIHTLIGGSTRVTYHYKGDLASGYESGLVVESTIAKDLNRHDPRGLVVEKVMDSYKSGRPDNIAHATEKFTYDNYAQLQTVVKTTNDPTAPNDGTTTQEIEYDANGNAVTNTKVAAYDRLLADDKHYYAYDNEGNRTETWTWGFTHVGYEIVDGEVIRTTNPIQHWGAGTYRLDFPSLKFTSLDMDEEIQATIKIGNTTLRVIENVPFSPDGSQKVADWPGPTFFHLNDTLQGHLSVTFDDITDAFEPDIVPGSAFTVEMLSSVDKYDWDYRNRLIQVTQYGFNTSGTTQTMPVASGNVQVPLSVGAIDTYLYDVHDQLIGKTYGGGTIEDKFIHERGQVVSYSAAGSALDVRLWGPGVDNLLADDEGSVSWAFSDYQGSIRHVLDGNNLSEILYEAFGKPRFDQNYYNVENFYAGREYDLSTQFYNNRARWYDPASGRFVSQDPIGFAGGDTNLYRYGLNSHPNGTDPSGRAVNLISGAIGAGVGAVVGGASYLIFADEFSWGGFGASVGVGAVVGGLAGLTFGASLAATGVSAGGIATATAASSGTVMAAGAVAGGIDGGLSTYAGNPNAGVGEYALGIGLGAGFGALNPVGAAGSLAGGVTMGASQYFGGGPFLGTGYLTGSLVGGLASGGFNAYRKAATTGLRAGLMAGAKTLAFEGGGAALGAVAGYAYYGDAKGALFGANLGMFAGGITRGALGLYNKSRSPNLAAVVNGINHNADVATELARRAAARGRISGGAQAFGSRAHKYFERLNDRLNRRLTDVGSNLRVFTEEFRDAFGNPTTRRARGSIGADAIVRSVTDATFLRIFDLKTHGGVLPFISTARQNEFLSRFGANVVEIFRQR